ncbi:FecR family protein [Sphingomonas nostoxanthinifaciens]|uniref:FecR family protein n=1 Tax=Sphingomonas nostoxanthinifaciens TaxID=2872652 RepID=UPI001CC1D042|nr:FecR domain-containing protein [Sphingomonas nostoxanthinifaciens]UAK25781.1 FecR domain-containing protein [Sphingomonas nostoxanthinifaciens]
MRAKVSDGAYEEAAAWHAKLARPDADFDAFADWLDADEGHQPAYDAIALIASDVDRYAEQIDAALPSNDLALDPSPRRLAWRPWAATCAAASAAAAAFLFTMPSTTVSRPEPVIIATGPAKGRTVVLKDGSSIMLDRNTRIAMVEGSERTVRLDRGAAFFDVKHDAARPFTVNLDSYRIRDLGTRFGVERQARQFSVAVESGLVDVAYQDGAPASLGPGQRLETASAEAAVEISKVGVGTVSSWRDGRLEYDNTPLRQVAADVSRYIPEPIVVDPAVADLRLSGVLVIGDGSHLVDQIQSLLPVMALHRNHGIRFVGVRGTR